MIAPNLKSINHLVFPDNAILQPKQLRGEIARRRIIISGLTLERIVRSFIFSYTCITIILFYIALRNGHSLLEFKLKKKKARVRDLLVRHSKAFISPYRCTE